MKIRVAAVNDAQTLTVLLGQLGYSVAPPIARKHIQAHRRGAYKLYVAEAKGKVVGFIALHWHQVTHLPGPVGTITGFCVDEKFRKTGVGTQLLATAEKFLKAKNCYKIEVTSNRKRKETHAWYLHHRYHQTSEHFVKLI